MSSRRLPCFPPFLAALIHFQILLSLPLLPYGLVHLFVRGTLFFPNRMPSSTFPKDTSFFVRTFGPLNPRGTSRPRATAKAVGLSQGVQSSQCAQYPPPLGGVHYFLRFSRNLSFGFSRPFILELSSSFVLEVSLLYQPYLILHKQFLFHPSCLPNLFFFVYFRFLSIGFCAPS